MVLAKERFGLREREEVARGLEFVPFSAETRMSGVQTNGTSIRKGASDAIQAWVGGRGGAFPSGLQESVDVVARAGGTPLVVARDDAGPGRDPPEGRGQGGDDPALHASCAGWASAR